MKTEIKDNENSNQEIVETAENQIVVSARTKSTRKRGMFKSVSNVVVSTMGTIETTAGAFETAMEIAHTSLKQSLAEAYIEGVKELVKLGYTQDHAENLLRPNSF